MAFDYASLADEAHELLVEFGRESIFKRKDVGTEVFDPATLTTSGASTVTASVIIADFDIETIDGGRFFQAAQGAGLVETGDREVLMSPKNSAGAVLTWEPLTGDIVYLGSESWIIKRVMQKIAPAGTNVLFVLQVRKGA